MNNLKIHQRTAKFCLQIQNKPAEVIYECDYCRKTFNIKSNYTTHNILCKEKKAEEDKNESIRMAKKIKELEKQLNDYKLKLSAKDESLKNLKEIIKKQEKSIEKLINKPSSTIINNNNTNTNNYQIQYNQLIQNIETLNYTSLAEKINSISIEEIDSYDPKNLEDSVSHSLSNKLKDYTFCTDKARKIFVIKKEDGTIDKIKGIEFINLSLNSVILDLRKYFKNIDEYYTDVKLAENKISEENFLSLDSSLQNIKEFMNRKIIDISVDDHPLKMLPDKVLMNCKHITKGN